MNRSPSSRRSRPRWVLLGLVSAAVLVLDQLSKDWAVRQLPGRAISVVWTLQLNLTYNKGTAFSLGGDRGQVIAAIAVAVVGFVLYTERNDGSKLGAVARGLVVGGALGNIVDRLFRDGNGFLSGRVVDFIDLQWWPVFNVADAAVVVGCILLVVSMVFREPERDRGEEPDESDESTAADVAH